MVLGVKSIAPIGSLQCGPCRALKNPCGQKTRTALKWRALRFCTGSLFKWTSPTQKQAYNLAFTQSSIAGEFESRTPAAKGIFPGGKAASREVRSRVGCCFRREKGRHWPRTLTASAE